MRPDVGAAPPLGSDRADVDDRANGPSARHSSTPRRTCRFTLAPCRCGDDAPSMPTCAAAFVAEVAA